MKTLVICTAMSAMILCACGGKNTQSTEETAKVVPMAVITPAINQLTDQEKAEGWALLFDGKTTKGWRGAHKDAFPDHGWMVKDGELIVQKSDGSKYVIPEINWTAGKRFIYSITMQSNSIEIGGENGQTVTIEPWMSSERDRKSVV